MLSRLIFRILLCSVLVVASQLLRSIYKFAVKKCENEMTWCPSSKDFLISGAYALAFIVLKSIMLYFMMGVANFYIHLRKTKDNTSRRHKATVNLKTSRFCYHMYRFIYYLIMTLWGYNILEQEPFFPVELGGKFLQPLIYDSNKMTLIASLKDLSPKTLSFIQRYFSITLGFQVATAVVCLNDASFSQVAESVLQIVLNITLIVCGYLDNHLFIGACLLWMHDCCDVLISWCQALVNTDYKSTTFLSAVSVLVAFAYFRIYCFAKLIFFPVIYAMEEQNLSFYEGSNIAYFFILLLCLFFMNIYWFSLLVKSCYVYVMYGRIMDSQISLKSNKHSSKEKIR